MLRVIRGRVLVYAGVLLCTALPSAAIDVVETFNSYIPGQVIAGELPQGGTAWVDVSGLLFTVTNTGGGPHSLIIFDSSNPTGGDWDLGTPNQDFGGPGIGAGGSPDSPVENNQSWGNLLIVAENLNDANADNIVDDPDDEEGGGTVQTEIGGWAAMFVREIVLVDIDANETATFDCYWFDDYVGTTVAMSLGDNSVQTVSLWHHGLLSRVVITLSSSGAIAQIEFEGVVRTQETTWGQIKSLYCRR